MRIDDNNIYVHFILITANRFPFISSEHRERIEKYITGIINNNDSKLYANPEHVHILLSKSPKLSEEKLLSIIAESSKKFIKVNKLCNSKYEWQNSAAAFSVSKSRIDKVCKYILNQPLHHKKLSFNDEFEKLMKYYQKTLKIDK